MSAEDALRKFNAMLRDMRDKAGRAAMHSYAWTAAMRCGLIELDTDPEAEGAATLRSGGVMGDPFGRHRPPPLNGHWYTDSELWAFRTGDMRTYTDAMQKQMKRDKAEIEMLRRNPLNRILGCFR